MRQGLYLLPEEFPVLQAVALAERGVTLKVFTSKQGQNKEQQNTRRLSMNASRGCPKSNPDFIRSKHYPDKVNSDAEKP